MFTPHQSVHQFSPQRRQILGTGKRLGQKKAYLGDEEASSVGPQKLFADLKNTSSKQASGSNVFSKSPSRALSVKNTQSPQRSQDYPSKPSVKRLESTAGQSEVSPVKAKSRARSQSPSKATRQISPVRDAPLSTTPLHNDLDEGTSYLTTATPFAKIPQTPPSDLLEQRAKQSFVTPASNIGEAGAIRLRKGEIFDALNQVQEEAHVDEGEPMVQSNKALEEEEYPEIEYMPPSIESPYDFPPELDGLPRARELGEGMAKMSVTGFYRPSSEERKQEMLAEIFKFRPAKAEAPVISRQENLEDSERWPDVEVSVPSKSQSAPGRPAPASSTQRASNTVPRKTVTVKSAMNGRPPVNAKSSIANTDSKASATHTKPRALGERDSNATIKKKAMNPALRDFENDQMGKIIKAKLQAAQSQETEGFVL